MLLLLLMMMMMLMMLMLVPVVCCCCCCCGGGGGGGGGKKSRHTSCNRQCETCPYLACCFVASFVGQPRWRWSTLKRQLGDLSSKDYEAAGTTVAWFPQRFRGDSKNGSVQKLSVHARLGIIPEVHEGNPKPLMTLEPRHSSFRAT